MDSTLKLIVPLVPVFVFLFFRQRLRSSWSFIMTLYLLIAIAIPLLNLGQYLYMNYRRPPEWDFLCFWSSGQVAIRGENFYDPQSFYRLSLPYNPKDSFQHDWMDIGFWYPPMTMLLFLPLGLLDISTAYLMWQTLNLLLCFACIYALWRFFFDPPELVSLLLVAELLLWLNPTRYTIRVAQTNFIILFLFLLFWQNRSKPWSGACLALGTVVKPYMALLYLYPFLTRKWKLLAIGVLTMVIIVILSIMIFGPAVIASFLKNPTPNVPGDYFTENVNQSLVATVLRSTGYPGGHESPLSNPLYLGISSLLACITLLTMVRNQKDRDGWVILSLLFLALLIYPGTLSHYGVFLMVPIVYLLSASNSSRGERVVIFVIIFVAYLLSGLNNSGDYIFFAHLFMWLVCISSAMGLLDRIAERVPAFSHRPGLML